MNKTDLKAKKLLNTTVLFLFAAPIVVLLYASYIFNPAHADNLLLYALLLIADSFGMLAILSLWLTILMDVIIPEHHQVVDTKGATGFLGKKPTIDILITAAGEPATIIKKTAKAAVAMAYPHKTFILDDGKSSQVKALAKKLGITYVTRDNRLHAKAGNINNGLTNSKADFFAILDADQVPAKNFIQKLLPYFSDKNLGLVQAPQNFVNTDNYIASGTTQAQDIFYKYVCPARNTSNSVFCVGTNVIFRRSAIDQIGGIAKLTHSEDIWTSYQLHEHGWKSLFVNEILTSGLAPETITAYSRQQHRWAKGGLSMLLTRNPLASGKLNLDQKIQYFFSNSFYLVGFSILMYTIFPVAYLLFNAKPLDTGESIVWLLHYVPYLAMYYFLTKLLLGKMNLSIISVSLATFYPYLLALFSTLLGSDHEWVATSSQKKGGEDAIMKWIWPHVLLIGLTVFSLIVGWINPINFWTSAFYSVLAGWNLYLLYTFITSTKRSTKQLGAVHEK